MTVARISMVSKGLRTNRLPAFELAAKCVFGIVFVATLTFSNRIDILVSGSDATSLLIAPPPIAQAAEIILAAACLLAPVNRRWRLILTFPALLLALLATHRLLIDGSHSEVRDIYALSTVQRLHLNPGQEGGFVVRASLMSVTLSPPGRTDTLTIITPLVVGLDRSLIESLRN